MRVTLKCYYDQIIDIHFFTFFVYNMTFLHILPNFNPLRTSEVPLFGLLFSRIYGCHYLTLFQGLVAN